MTHFYYIHDDAELLALGAAEHQRLTSQAELAAFVREQESPFKTLRRDSSDASLLSTLEDPSECSSSDAKPSSGCRWSDEVPEDAIWGEEFVTRIQAWYRMCASSQTRKEFLAKRIQAWYRDCASRKRRTSLPDGTAETQVAEEECKEEPFKPEMEVFATCIQAWYRGYVSRQERKPFLLLLHGTAGPQVEEEEPFDPDMHVLATRNQAWYRGCASRRRRNIFFNGAAEPQVEEEEPFKTEMHVFATRVQAWYRGHVSKQERKPFLHDTAGTQDGKGEPSDPKVVLATPIQALCKGCVSRQKSKLLLGGTAATQADEEEPEPEMVVATRTEACDRSRASSPKKVLFSDVVTFVYLVEEEEEEELFELDMDLFTSARLSTCAFEERVRTRAYHLFLSGCRDQRKNYFNALEAERKLAHCA